MSIIATPSHYNEFTGRENKPTEYKEFTFNLAGFIMETKLAEKYCQNSVFDFNNLVISNLKKYFKIYVPKYFTAFNNVRIDTDANLYIGINDYGFTKGIPYKGTLPFEYLEKKIFKSLKKYIQHSNTFKFNELIEIKFIKISLPDIPTISTHPKIIDYLSKKNSYQNDYFKWVESFENWKIRYSFFSQKLVDLVNNKESRELLVQWIKSKDPNSPCINMLESDYQLEYKDHNEITILKNDPTNVYYWVCLWKDHVTDYLKTIKPVFSHEFNQHNLPINLIVSVNEMIPYWTNFNSDMNLYLICIKFKNLNLDWENKVMIRYREPGKKPWLCCYRTLNTDGTPYCEPC